MRLFMPVYHISLRINPQLAEQYHDTVYLVEF